MKALIQRVRQAKVCVDNQTIGSIEKGILVYIGIGHDDNLDKAKKLIDKILTYRIFENTIDADKLGKMDKSLSDIRGGLLLVSQFTLMANTKNGRRPDFAPVMHPKQAKLLFNDMIDYAKQIYPNIATGEFGADMQVFSINDGPINFLLEI
mgnify:FL=1